MRRWPAPGAIGQAVTSSITAPSDPHRLTSPIIDVGTSSAPLVPQPLDSQAFQQI